MIHVTRTATSRRILGTVFGLMLAALAPVSALGAALTLKTITIDGTFADWDEVLQNPAQATSDANGSSLSCDVSGDLDCPMRFVEADARVFAWTRDDSYLYFHLRRQQGFDTELATFIYLDVTGPDGLADGLMGSGDRVLRVRHDGLTGTTSKTLLSYVPLETDGDPLTDRAGRADGYTLPGRTDPGFLWQESGSRGGASSGLAFEERIPWSILGLAPDAPVHFHVSTSLDATPGAIGTRVDDNLGGPDGGIGFIGSAGCAMGPDRRATALPGGVVRHVHELRNVGSLPAAFAVAARSSLASRVALREDRDGDGSFESLVAEDANGDGDFADRGDTLARDADGDGYPEMPASPALLAAGAALAFEVEIQSLAQFGGATDVTTLDAWQPPDRLASRASVTDITLLGAIVVDSRESVKIARAAEDVAFAVTSCNQGLADVLEFSASSGAGWPVSLLTDPECDGAANQLIAVDASGDGTWDVVMGGDSDGDGRPDTGRLETGSCSCHVLRVGVPSGTADATSQELHLAAQGSASASSGAVALRVEVRERLDVSPDHLCSRATGMVTIPGRSVFFPHVIRNNGGAGGAVDLTARPLGVDRGWMIRLWSDPDGDGTIADGVLTSGAVNLAANGGEARVIVEVQVPDGVAAGTISSILVTATSSSDSTQAASVRDELIVSTMATFADSLFLRPATAFAPCDAVHLMASGLVGAQGAGSSDRYDLAWIDGAPRLARFVDAFVPDDDGVATDRHDVRVPDVPGRWMLELGDDGVVSAQHPFRVEASGRIEALAATRPSYTMNGEALAVTCRLVNRNDVTTLGPSTVEHVVLDPTASLHLASGLVGEFTPTDGTRLTRRAFIDPVAPGNAVDVSFVVPAVAYPLEGTYWLVARWRSACGVVIAESFATFQVRAGESCRDGVDNNADALVDCADPACQFEDGDCDGDGVLDFADCDPAEPSASAPPAEVRSLVVRKVLDWPGSFVEIGWGSDTARGAPATGFDVVSGRLRELWVDHGFARAQCLVADVPAPPSWDGRRGPDGAERGFYYLVRARNGCGTGTWGQGPAGMERSVGTEPCR